MFQKAPSFETNSLRQQQFQNNQRTIQCVISTVLYCTVQYNTVMYCTVQYSRVQYCTVQYSTIQYSTVQYCTVLYSTVQYNTVLYCTVLYCTVQYSTVLYCTVQYSTVLYSTIQYNTVLTCCNTDTPATQIQFSSPHDWLTQQQPCTLNCRFNGQDELQALSYLYEKGWDGFWMRLYFTTKPWKNFLDATLSKWRRTSL